MNTVINIVLFDYSGVIAEEGFRAGLLAIARNNGLDPEAFYHTACRIIADSGYLTGDIAEAAFWDRLRRECGLARPDAELRSEILNRFTLRPGILDIAARLRRGGMRVGILSDHTNWLDELDRRDGFFACFDPVLNSFHLQASKYDDTLFDVAAVQLGGSPESILLVDDTLANIERARQRGFTAILYEDEKSLMREMQGFFPDVFPRNAVS